LREQQDQALRDAEKRDSEKRRIQQERETAERLKREREERELREKEEQVEKLHQWRRYARKHLLPPSTGSIRVSFRTPLSSERTIRHFEAGCSTAPLFIFAETLLIPPSERPEDDPDAPPAGFEPDFGFRIVTAYPRKEVERTVSGGEAQWEVVQQAGGALFAENIEGGIWGKEELKALKGEESDEELED